ncbi:MAG: hypothetical protein WA005_20035 [Candidatus Binataceae bacterium]
MLGSALYRELRVIRFVEFTGIYGVSALIIMVNVAVCKTIEGVHATLTRRGCCSRTDAPTSPWSGIGPGKSIPPLTAAHGAAVGLSGSLRDNSVRASCA